MAREYEGGLGSPLDRSGPKGPDHFLVQKNGIHGAMLQKLCGDASTPSPAWTRPIGEVESESVTSRDAISVFTLPIVPKW